VSIAFTSPTFSITRSVTHSTVTAIYDRYRYDKEKRTALQKWAAVLTEIVEVKPAPTTAPAHPGSASECVRVQIVGCRTRTGWRESGFDSF